MTKEALIERLLEEGILVSPEQVDALSDDQTSTLLTKKTLSERDFVVEKKQEATPSHLQSTPPTHRHPTNPSTTQEDAPQPKPPTPPDRFAPNVTIINSYDKPSKKRTYDDFVAMFRHRYRVLAQLLRGRQEMQGVMSISRATQKRDNENISIIAMVKEKTLTKNKNYLITFEDPTGELKAVVTHQKREVAMIADDMVLDEVVGVSGSYNGRMMFVNNIVLPDVPMTHELKKAPYEQYVVFIGDPQVGGIEFLEEEWKTLIAWLNGRVGNNQQKAIAKKVKYIVIPGDCVEGVGVYPGQENDLVIKDIKEQYTKFTEYLKRFPQDVQIIICPGNHDAGRIAEPQPPLYRDFAEDLYALPNVTIVSSPGTIRFGITNDFPGFDMLLYHGYSLIYYSDTVPSIRNAGGQKVTERIMQFLLQRRHLAPSHGSNRYIPDADEDPLVITHVPDFFITGHIHRAAVGNYRNVTMINASAWTDITEDQEKRGLEPQPARLPLVNLKTREVKVINFYKGKKVAVGDPPQRKDGQQEQQEHKDGVGGAA